jgi:predicted MFS family arabinose efflux permease
MGKCIFDPALQAYVGARVPYNRRGRIIGILEICWAGSTLVGIPLVAVLIDNLGWRSPFWMLGALGLLGLLVLMRLLPKEEKAGAGPEQQDEGILGACKKIFGAWGQLFRNPTALAALCFAFFISAANDNLFVIYGAWLEHSFGLSVIALGVGTSVIGAAELTGELMTATVADRLGLSRSIAVGMALNIVCCMTLPFLAQTLFLALTGLFLIFLTFEFTFVTALSFCTEVVPGARATMMSAFLAAAGLGRVAGALMGGPVWLEGGIRATGTISAGIGILALAALLSGLCRRKKP